MDRFSIVKAIISKIENGVFVEIGTAKGDFADFILENSINSTLYCIDPYLSYTDYDDSLNTQIGDNYFYKTYDRLKSKYGDRVQFIRKFSQDALNDIPNNIDFLYIDGNHRFEYVSKELELYYPKVKSNNYIIGDDAVDLDDSLRNKNGDILINWDENNHGHYGVVKAFREFIEKNNLYGEITAMQCILRKP